MRASRDIEYILISHKVGFMIYLLMQGRWCDSVSCHQVIYISTVYAQLTIDIFMEYLPRLKNGLPDSTLTTWPSFPYRNNACNEFVVPNRSDGNESCAIVAETPMARYTYWKYFVKYVINMRHITLVVKFTVL